MSLTKSTATPLYFVAPWDLNQELACIPPRPGEGSVLLVESIAKGAALPFHRKKLTLVLSAMHHFAEQLREGGYDVELVRAGTYVEGIRNQVKARKAPKVIAMEPREWGLDKALRNADARHALGAPLELRSDGGAGGHFLLTRAEFLAWARTRKQIRMVDFYRWMRKRSGYLMDGAKPEGGKWSFDSENRRHAKGLTPPAVKSPVVDVTTEELMRRVKGFGHAWGRLEGFEWPVTRGEALDVLESFLGERADNFGQYQDAMLEGQPFMWHSLISAAMNLSLLSPKEVCDRVVTAYASGAMPLSAAEGFIRQILGWREFIRGIYWLRMPGLRDANLLDATRPLPDFFWNPERTEMNCLRRSIEQVRDTGYAHHIQRLMVQGNFALLAGIRPLDISHWFWAAFVDAYEWVELPNVHGMAVYADDTFTTKPYAASGNYINKMSNYCSGCRYAVKKRSGSGACPFNFLFWSFMARHRQRLVQNPRLGLLFRSWDKLSQNERDAIISSAEVFLESLSPPTEGWRFSDDAC